MHATQRLSLTLVHVAALLFGLAGVLGKLIPLPATIIVLGRVAFSSVALGGLLVMRRTTIRWRARRDLAVLAISGVILAAHWTAFFKAVQIANVAVALLAFSTFPLFTTTLEPLLLRTYPRRVDVLAALLILPGMYLIVPVLSFSNTATQGAAWGIFAGFLFALLSIWNRRLTQRYPSAVISFYQDVSAALVLLPSLALFRPDPTQLLDSLLVLMLLGVVCTALAHTLFIEGMRTLTAQTASVVAALEPVWGILLAALALAEVPSPRTLLGGALIVGAVVLPSVVLPSRVPHTKSPPSLGSLAAQTAHRRRDNCSTVVSQPSNDEPYSKF